MREKPHKTGCLSLHNCRCPNPKKHKLHKQIFIKKKMVHMMPGRPEKTEYNFHNNLKSVFGYTLEGERVWDHTAWRASKHCPHLGGWQDEECENVESLCAFRLLLLLQHHSHWQRQCYRKQLKHLFFSCFLNLTDFTLFPFTRKAH